MNTDKKMHIILILAFFISISVLTACGGRSDSNSGVDNVSEILSYVGLETPVLIDANNAVEVSANALENGYGMANTSDAINIRAISADYNVEHHKPFCMALAHAISDFLDQVDIINTYKNVLYLGAVQQFSESEIGTCGGQATHTMYLNDETGEFALNANFYNYCTNSGVTINGGMGMIGRVDSNSDSMTAIINFNNLKVTLQDTGVSATTSGTINLTGSLSIDDFYMDMDIIMRDDNASKTYKGDLGIHMYDMSDTYANFTMSGRFYDPDYGYSDISTESPFFVILSDNMPSSGALVITGANGIAGGSTKAKLSIIDRYTYEVYADTTGDGNYDYHSGTQSW